MTKKGTPPFTFQHVYPRVRYMMGLGRNIYKLGVNLRTSFIDRPLSSSVLPDAYNVCNTDTIDSEFNLSTLSGEMPADIDGSLNIAQCLGSPRAFIFGDSQTKLTNRLMWMPSTLARQKLANPRHCYDPFDLMYLSPGCWD